MMCSNLIQATHMQMAFEKLEFEAVVAFSLHALGKY